METYKQVEDQTWDPDRVKLIPPNVVGPIVLRMETPCPDIPPKKRKLTGLRLMPCLFLDDNSKEVKIFGKRIAAKVHIEKHMLHKTESYLWEALCPESAQLIHKYRGTLCEQIGESGELQQLYTSYARVIVAAMNCAMKAGTVVSSGDRCFYLGLSGMFVVMENGFVRTAYFPKNNRLHHPEANIGKTKHELSKLRKNYKKHIKKNKGLRRIWAQGLSATMEYYKTLPVTAFDYQVKKELGRLALSFSGMGYKDWKELFNSMREEPLVVLLDEHATVTIESKQLNMDSVAA